ncbi:unnamed protein product, partial [Diamesa tonsa]
MLNNPNMKRTSPDDDGWDDPPSSSRQTKSNAPPVDDWDDEPTPSSSKKPMRQSKAPPVDDWDDEPTPSTARKPMRQSNAPPVDDWDDEPTAEKIRKPHAKNVPLHNSMDSEAISSKTNKIVPLENTSESFRQEFGDSKKHREKSKVMQALSSLPSVASMPVSAAIAAYAAQKRKLNEQAYDYQPRRDWKHPDPYSYPVTDYVVPVDYDIKKEYVLNPPLPTEECEVPKPPEFEDSPESPVNMEVNEDPEEWRKEINQQKDSPASPENMDVTEEHEMNQNQDENESFKTYHESPASPVNTETVTDKESTVESPASPVDTETATEFQESLENVITTESPVDKESEVVTVITNVAESIITSEDNKIDESPASPNEQQQHQQQQQKT